MGKHRQAYLEQQRSKERLRRRSLRASGAGIVLAAATAAGLLHFSDDSSDPSEAIPADLQAYLDGEVEKEPTGDYDQFAAHYHYLENRDIGPSTVHYVRIGDTEVRQNDINLHAQTYQKFVRMADRAVRFTMNAYPADQVEQGVLPVTPADAHVVATPDAEQDLYVLFVDSQFKLGDIHDIGASTTAVTVDLDDRSEAAVTFIRNDAIPTEEQVQGVTTEACQAAVSFQIENSQQFNMTKPSGNMADEPACNLFGPLIGLRVLDMPYQTYVQRRDEALSMRLFFADETSTYATEIPIASPAYYDSFLSTSGDIVAPQPSDLRYPLMGPFLGTS